MADIKDVSEAIHSALSEIGVNGELDVKMEGDRVAAPIGHPTGDDIAVSVTVSELEPDAADTPASPETPRK